MDNFIPHYPAKLPEDIQTWAREIRGRMTDAEALLWMMLRDRRLAGAKFRRQRPVGRFILDYYCVEKKLGIELDGGQHSDAAVYDRHRDEAVQELLSLYEKKNVYSVGRYGRWEYGSMESALEQGIQAAQVISGSSSVQ